MSTVADILLRVQQLLVIREFGFTLPCVIVFIAQILEILGFAFVLFPKLNALVSLRHPLLGYVLLGHPLRLHRPLTFQHPQI